jgi:hypothetical protein
MQGVDRSSVVLIVLIVVTNSLGTTTTRSGASRSASARSDGVRVLLPLQMHETSWKENEVEYRIEKTVVS